MSVNIHTHKKDLKIHPFRVITLKKLRIEENFPSLIKNIYERPTANIIFNGERLKDFPLHKKRTVMQEKEAKGTQIGKEKVKASLFLDVILCI